jgi:hypothetical protein
MGKVPVAGERALGLARGWLGVGGLRVGGFGAGKLSVGAVWASSHHRNLSRAMALHVAKSTGRSLRFRAFFSVRPKFISGNPIGRGCATKPVSSCRGARLMGVRAA